MLDGSDAVSDWPLLNLMSNTAGGATWVSFHHGGGVGMGYSQHAGMVVLVDGTERAEKCIKRVLHNDPAMGVFRHNDAGYDISTGNNNTCLGMNAGRATSPSGAISTASNIICLGDNNVTDLYCNDTSISSSDSRDKTDVADFTHGLNWVNQLKPVTYRWDKRTWYDDNTPCLLYTSPSPRDS